MRSKIAQRLIDQTPKEIKDMVDAYADNIVLGNTLLAAVSDKKLDLIKEYLEPTGITIKELMDRNAFAALNQLLDAYLLEAVRNSR